MDMPTFIKGNRLSKQELRPNMHVLLHRCDKGILVDNEAEAIVEDACTFRRLTDVGECEFNVESWDGDTIVHEAGKRFEVYELIRGPEQLARFPSVLDE